ncbi:MAG: UDP-N-acetylmuramate dehydrogenase [Mycobacteriales bacterium]
MEVVKDVTLAPYTTLRLGGPAGVLAEPTTAAELVEAVAAAEGPVLVLAGGSNVVIGDGGFAGTVVLVRTRGVAIREDGDRVLLTAQAGEVWDDLVERCVREGWVGLECLSGIPGSTGATPIQNVGAYGQEVAETVVSVRAYDRRVGAVVEMTPAECGFRYRHSVFKGTDRWVVLDVTFALGRGGDSAPIRYAELARTLGVDVGGRVPLDDVRAAVLGLRRGKGMVLDADDHDTWSVGSFFTNPVLPAGEAAALRDRAGADPPSWPAGTGDAVKFSAAWLIEHAGFAKGYRRGPVAVSGKHTLALTNRGGASTADLLDLAREIRDGVRSRFGVTLVNEPVLVNADL